MRRDTWSVVAVAAFAVLAVPAQMTLGAVVSQPAGTAPGLDAGAVRRVYAALPLAFEANRGQVDSGAGFVARGSGYAFLLTPTGATLVGPVDTMRSELVGANPSAPATGVDELPGRSNSFVGDDPARWRTAVPTYAGVRYRGVYPGIDLVYHGVQGSLEYDFVVDPGADPRVIRLRVDGAGPLPAPSHQPAPETRAPRGALVIDPVITWSPPFRAGLDSAFVSIVDGSGAIYVVSGTPPVGRAAAGPGPPADGVMVVKLDPSGDRVLYATYLARPPGAEGLTVDALGGGAIEVSSEVGVPAAPLTGDQRPAAAGLGGPPSRFHVHLDARGLATPDTGVLPG